MNAQAKASLSPSVIAWPTPTEAIAARTTAEPKKTELPWSTPEERLGLKQDPAPGLARRKVENPLIFAVDDMPSLTELYYTVLEEAGYMVRTFNDRSEALAALKTAVRKPDLLIMDYLGHSMPPDWFIQQCRVLHPGLRILLASGVSQIATRFSRIKPDRFIQKPFTLNELREEVRITLTLG